MKLSHIISGGQTGIDRAALDVAIESGVACGGWCPRGRRAEDGPIDQRYPLRETPWAGYPQRTEWNVRDSDGTLILTPGEPDRGTLLTVRIAEKRKKPHIVVDPSALEHVEAVRVWIVATRIETLNVAGPRESSMPGIYRLGMQFLKLLLEQSDRESR